VVSIHRARYLAAALVLAASACAGNRSLPAASGTDGAPFALRAPSSNVDTTSILNALKKTVAIGSTVDPKNGDNGPHGLAIASTSYGKLKKGDLVACNFDNKAKAAGQGTTLEALAPVAGSKPATFAQNAAVKGCAAVALTGSNEAWGAGFGAKSVTLFDQTGAFSQAVKNAAIVAPFGETYAKISAFGSSAYPELVVFAGDASTGSILRIDVTNLPSVMVTVIAKGFAVNKKSGTAAFGPSGLQYDAKANTLYVVDGANDTVVAFTNAGNILLKNAITVNAGGKTFSGPEAKYAKLVYSGSALKSPVASALLPNGNLVIANTVGNTLVEMTPAGQVLATKVVDSAKTPAVFGLAASGTSDANTVLFYTDSNTNTVQELTR